MGAEPLRKVKENFKKAFSEDSELSFNKVKRGYTDELIIGICAPIGTNKIPVIDEIEERLTKDFGYKVMRVKLSSIIQDLYSKSITPIKDKTAAFSEFIHKIEGGNHIREKSNNKSILAEFAVATISNDRHFVHTGEQDTLADTEDLKSQRKCYIIDSLKNTDEIDLLRLIYRDMFYLFSIYSPIPERTTVLSGKDLSPTEIEELINKDDYDDSGQDVRNTFVEADFFVRASIANTESVNRNINRFLNLIFESRIVTPLSHETAMYKATSAAGNSACLSRQVGACITDADSNLLSVGWNDVPKAGGNLYTEGDKIDNRCFTLHGKCSNDFHKQRLALDIVDRIISLDSLESKDEVALKADLTHLVMKSQLKNLIEFSRSVHAEMHAIISGSQLTGSKMIGGKLFCTTYPCHNCARHIVAAGIKEVYYIEPYKKSLCLTLHDDSMTEDEQDETKVKILVYDGVAPRRYLSFFSKRKDRKDDKGILKTLDKTIISPRNRVPLQSLITLENQVIQSLPSEDQ